MNKLFLLLPFLLLAGCIDTGGIAAQQGDTIKADYVGSFENGTVFDTSIQSVAQAAGLPQRPSYEPLEFVVGSGALIKGFDDTVRGMKVNEEKTVRIPPNEAYGNIDPELIVDVPRENVQGDVTVGSMLSGGGREGKVVSVSNETIRVDFNHPLAGQTLVFKIKVVNITRN